MMRATMIQVKTLTWKKQYQQAQRLLQLSHRFTKQNKCIRNTKAKATQPNTVQWMPAQKGGQTEKAAESSQSYLQSQTNRQLGLTLIFFRGLGFVIWSVTSSRPWQAIVNLTTKVRRRATPLEMTKFLVSVRFVTVYPIICLFKQLSLNIINLELNSKLKLLTEYIILFLDNYLRQLLSFCSSRQQNISSKSVFMTSTDMRKRLNSLRNLTQDLKQSTQSPNINVNYIKSLIGNLKQISETPGYPSKCNQNNNEKEYSPNSVEYEASSEEYNRLYQTKKSIDARKQASNEKEIIALREENLRLEEKIASMREELLKVEKVEKNNWQKQEQEEKDLPYFRSTQNYNVFVCRFEISESDYSKVEYVQQKVELQLDKILIYHKQKSSVQQFDITILVSVTYLPGNVILYRFQQAGLGSRGRFESRRNYSNVFLKFDSGQSLKKWDLSLFVNYQLVTSLKGKQLFKDHFQRIKNAESLQSDREMLENIRKSQEKVGPQEQKFLLQMFRKRKEAFVEVRTLIQEKLQIKKQTALSEEEITSPAILSGQNSNIKKPLNDPPPKKEEPLKKDGEGGQEKPDNRPQKRDIKLIEQTPVKGSKEKQFPINSNVSETANRGHVISFSKEQLEPISSSLSNYALNTGSSPNTYFQNNYSTVNTSKRKDTIESRNRSNSQQTTKRLSVVQFKIGEARKKLQEGYDAIKYSKDGFYPHEKKVFLSLDCKKLCWCQRDKESQYKSIPLEVIIKVEYGVIGQGIAKHVKKFSPLAYCVIEYYTGDYKKKTIELEGETIEKTKRFAEELQIILDFSKGMSMNALVDS